MFGQERYEVRRWVLLLLLTVVTSGLLLGITGNLRNSFDALSNITNFVNPGNAVDAKGPPPSSKLESQKKDQYGTVPPESKDQGKDDGGKYDGPQDKDKGGGKDNGSKDGGFSAIILWKLFGPFLFNLWLLAAAISAVIIINILLQGRLQKERIANVPHD
jgi:hypothetical protein